MRKYISDGTWFKVGSECILIANCQQCGGVFKGNRTKRRNSESDSVKIGEDYIDEEVCMWQEFGYIWDARLDDIRKATKTELIEWKKHSV